MGATRKDYTLVALKALERETADLLERKTALDDQLQVKVTQYDAIVATLTPEQKAKLGSTAE